MFNITLETNTGGEITINGISFKVYTKVDATPKGSRHSLIIQPCDGYDALASSIYRDNKTQDMIYIFKNE